MFYLKMKRVIDVFLSVIALIVLSLPFLLIILAIKIDSKGPILFRQKRLGIRKSHFNILKFRTMLIDSPKDTPTHLLDNPQKYITRVGNFLRKTSLDELPQIFNIIAGQMSFVGPRPALWNQSDLIEQRDRYGVNDIRPGLTGWAQINGRDEISIEAKAKLDGEYIRRMSFWFDVRCFFCTIVHVCKRDGVLEGRADQKKREKAVKQEEAAGMETKTE